MEEYVVCAICNKKMKTVNNFHLKVHDITIKEYKKLYPDSNMYSELSRYIHGNTFRGKKRPDHSLKMMGENNPSFGVKKSKETLELMSKNRIGKGIGVAGKYERTEEIKFKISEGVCDAYLENRMYIPSSYSGYYYSTKTKRKCIYRSNWELLVMKYLDIHPLVTFWIHEPFYVEYLTSENKKRNYIPDFLVRIDDGAVREIWEVKPQYYLHDKIKDGFNNEIENKMKGIQKLIDEGEIHNFVIIDDDMINIIININWKEIYSYYGKEFDEKILL